MRIHSLQIEHFKTYRDRVEIPLDSLGLVLVKGQNDVSEASDSNGAGKSSLIVDAPSWILYGMTPTGLRGDEVACRFTKDQCIGSMTLEDENGIWTITRTRRPATLTVEGWDGEDMKALQARIEQRLGRGFKTFKNTIVFGQGNFERFSQADQAEQIKMLDEIQGVDFTKPLARADTWRKSLQAKVESIQDSIRNDEDGMGRMTHTVSQLEQAQAQFDKNQAEKVKELTGRKARLIRERDQIHKLLEDLNAQQEEVKNLRKLWDGIEEWRVKTQESERAAGIVVAQVEREHGLLEAKKKKLETMLLGGNCPSCRATFTPEASKKVREAYKAELAEAEDAYNSAALDADEAQQKWKNDDTFYKKARKAWRYDTFDVSVINTLERQAGPEAVQRGEQEYKRLSRDIDALVKEIAQEKTREWEAAETLSDSRAALGAITTHLKESRIELQRSMTALKAAAYWVTAFGDRGIRSMLVDSVAGYLNDRLAYHLGKLAGGEVNVTVSALSMLKSGKTKEDLSITPTWAWGAAGVGLGSAGQDRRVDLALFAAMQDLAESRASRPFPMQVLDEPFDSIDQRGREAAVDWVMERKHEKGTIFLVTHSQELAASVNPDEEWTIVLDKEGSHLVKD